MPKKRLTKKPKKWYNSETVTKQEPAMTQFLIRLIDAIPTPTPEQGDRAVMYTCIFGLGFIVGMLAFGG